MSSLVSSLSITDQPIMSLDHIDGRSKKIVYGYIHRIQARLLLDDYEDDDINRYVPRSVYLFLMELIDDHFMIQQSTKQWTFSGPSLDRMLNAVNTQLIQTEFFEACKMQWVVRIYPNGDRSSNAGEFRFFLVNLEMPSMWETVTIRYTVHIQPLSFTCTHIRKFDKEANNSWGDERLSFQEFTNLHPNQLTITLTLRILQIKLDKNQLAKTQTDTETETEVNDILYHYEQPIPMTMEHTAGRFSLEWKIDDEQMQTIRNNLNNLPRRYESETFHNLWKLVIWPNDSNNRCILGLLMLGLPKQCHKNETANVRWTLGIKEGSVFQQKLTKFSYSGWISDNVMLSLWDSDTLTSTEFQTYTTVTIYAEIQILDFEQNNDSEQKTDAEATEMLHVNDEWKQYMAQNEGLEMAFMQRLVSAPMRDHDESAKQEDTKKEEKEKKEEESESKEDETAKMEKLAKKQEVKRWLKEDVKLPQYYKLFNEQGFDDLECFEGLTYEILDSYGFSDIKKGHRLKILRYVKKLEKVLP